MGLIFITAISVHNHNNATKKDLEAYTFGAVRFGMFSTYFTVEGSHWENTYDFENPNYHHKAVLSYLLFH